MLARGRYWRAELLKGSGAVAVTLDRDALPREFEELADFRIELPLREWRRLLRLLRADRKLLGGLLLDFARQKDRLSAVIASDRLYCGLVEILGETTLSLLECEALELMPPEGGA
jgi:hypothetical protein